MPETTVSQEELTSRPGALKRGVLRQNSSLSLHDLWHTVRRDVGLFLAIIGALLFACLIYCMVAANVYEATARVALRGAPASVLALDRNESTTPGSFASGQVQLETLANVFRSDRLAWRVITDLKLYQSAGVTRPFAQKFPNFVPAQPDPMPENGSVLGLTVALYSSLIGPTARQVVIRANPIRESATGLSALP